MPGGMGEMDWIGVKFLAERCVGSGQASWVPAKVGSSTYCQVRFAA